MLLPCRSSDWNCQAPLTFPSVGTPSQPFSFTQSPTSSPYVLEAFVAKAPWVSKPLPCPVNNKNRDTWTELERGKAQDRVVATSLDHFQELVFLSLSLSLYCIPSCPDHSFLVEWASSLVIWWHCSLLWRIHQEAPLHWGPFFHNFRVRIWL